MRVAFWFWHLAVDSFELFFLRACWCQHRRICYNKIKLLYFSRAPRLRKFGYLCIQEICVLTESSVGTYICPFMLADVKCLLLWNWLNWCWTAMSWPLDSCQNRVSPAQCHMTVSQAQVYNSSKWCVLFRLLLWLVIVLKSSQARKT